MWVLHIYTIGLDVKPDYICFIPHDKLENYEIPLLFLYFDVGEVYF